MKLRIVPAHTGVLWVKLGIQTFLKRPLAHTGLFFLFMAMLPIVGLLPYVGSLLALALIPAATLGLMAATQESANGQFPMPKVLFSALRAPPAQRRAMAVLGGIYMVAVLLSLGLSALIDKGQFAGAYLLGNPVNEAMLETENFQWAALVAMALYTPVSMAFWHAPALVYWHGISPMKAIFFSLVACKRNFWAFTVYIALWTGLLLGATLIVALLATLLGSPESTGVILLPVALLLTAMFFTSLYFSFRDCFDETATDAA